MREILFRGFHPQQEWEQDRNDTITITLNGKKIKGWWVEGSLLSQVREDSLTFIVTHEVRFGACQFCGECSVAYDTDCQIEVLSETVGQNTGLIDKNGNKIFEGDIVQSEEYQQGDEVGEVVYDSKDCTYWVHSEKQGWWLTLNEIELEVIGNKWEIEE